MFFLGMSIVCAMIAALIYLLVMEDKNRIEIPSGAGGVFSRAQAERLIEEAKSYSVVSEEEINGLHETIFWHMEHTAIDSERKACETLLYKKIKDRIDLDFIESLFNDGNFVSDAEYDAISDDYETVKTVLLGQDAEYVRKCAKAVAVRKVLSFLLTAIPTLGVHELAAQVMCGFGRYGPPGGLYYTLAAIPAAVAVFIFFVIAVLISESSYNSTMENIHREYFLSSNYTRRCVSSAVAAGFVAGALMGSHRRRRR